MKNPRYHLAPFVSLHDQIDGLAAVDAAQGLHILFKGSARTLVRVLERGAGRHELEAELLSDFDVDPARARSDVERFLADLLAKDLIRESESDETN